MKRSVIGNFAVRNTRRRAKSSHGLIIFLLLLLALLSILNVGIYLQSWEKNPTPPDAPPQAEVSLQILPKDSVPAEGELHG